MDVIDRVPSLGSRAAGLHQAMLDERARALRWTRAYGEDTPEIQEWLWPA
jgi:xylulose-5-phosphate/fructose-6-phosphate phosphoketolase